MDINEIVHVSDLKYEGLTVMERPNDVVVAIKVPKKKEEASGRSAPGAAAGAPAKCCTSKGSRMRSSLKPFWGFKFEVGPAYKKLDQLILWPLSEQDPER
jgi:hypothetical protein